MKERVEIGPYEVEHQVHGVDKTITWWVFHRGPARQGFSRRFKSKKSTTCIQHKPVTNQVTLTTPEWHSNGIQILHYRPKCSTFALRLPAGVTGTIRSSTHRVGTVQPWTSVLFPRFVENTWRETKVRRTPFTTSFMDTNSAGVKEREIRVAGTPVDLEI